MYRIGQLIEEMSLELTQYRALLAFQFDEAIEFQILEALLVSNQNLSNYRSVYRTYFDIAPALDLLFLNKQNPISILSQLEQLLKFIDQLPHVDKGVHETSISNMVFECYSRVRLLSIDELLKVDPEVEFRAALDKVCEELSIKIGKISMSLTAQYFSHTTYQSADAKDNFKLEI